MTTAATYVVRDAAGGVIYVGQTSDPRERLATHRRDSAWWPEMASIEVHTHDTIQAMLADERRLIRQHRPRFNVTFNTGREPVFTPSCVVVEDLPDLVTGADVARRLEITRQRVHQMREQDGFPTPLGKVGSSIVWRWADVEKWAIKTGRLDPAT